MPERHLLEIQFHPSLPFSEEDLVSLLSYLIGVSGQDLKKSGMKPMHSDTMSTSLCWQMQVVF